MAALRWRADRRYDEVSWYEQGKQRKRKVGQDKRRAERIKAKLDHVLIDSEFGVPGQRKSLRGP